NVGNSEEFLKHDVRFHQAIARAADNKLMSGIMDTVPELLFHMPRHNAGDVHDINDAIAGHQKIIIPMHRHDPQRAQDMVAGHLRAANDAWTRVARTETNGKVVDNKKAGKKKEKDR